MTKSMARKSTTQSKGSSKSSPKKNTSPKKTAPTKKPAPTKAPRMAKSSSHKVVGKNSAAKPAPDKKAADLRSAPKNFGHIAIPAPPPSPIAKPVEPTVPATPTPAVAKIAHPKERTTRHLRAPIEIRVEITARNQSFTATSRNIALGGISFESSQEFRVGDLVNVLLYIPVKKELELLKVASEVVWVEDVSGSWMIGSAFRKFAPGDERRLRAWLLESVAAQKAGRPYGM